MATKKARKTTRAMTRFEKTTLETAETNGKMVSELRCVITEKDEQNKRLVAKLIELREDNTKLSRRCDSLFETAKRLNTLLMKEIDMHNTDSNITFYETGARPVGQTVGVMTMGEKANERAAGEINTAQN